MTKDECSLGYEKIGVTVCENARKESVLERNNEGMREMLCKMQDYNSRLAGTLNKLRGPREPSDTMECVHQEDDSIIARMNNFLASMDHEQDIMLVLLNELETLV